MNTQRCLDCGMQVPAASRHCPKCDNDLSAQTDGSTRVVDIAHQGETVREALAKLDLEIRKTARGTARYLLVIVGSGLIREEVGGELAFRARRGDIKDFDKEPHNPGAYRVRLK